MAKDKGEVLGEIRGSFTQGVKYYNSGNLLGAETEFVKALRPLMSKPIMKAIHPGNIEGVKVELLRSMYHLGEIYLRGGEVLKAKYGECTDHHSKAAAIFQYCSRFAEKYNATIYIEGKVADSQYFVYKSYDVERVFLAQASGVGAGSRAGDESYYENYRQKIENYKTDLANIRAAAREMLDEISDLGVDQIADRAASVEDIYRTSSQFFVEHPQESMSLAAASPVTTSETRVGNGFIQRLLQECYEQLGPVPEGCDYSIIALGSLSLGTMTPWSDLEFAILVNQDREDYKEYFRNLTKLLHIKTINLAETPLQSVGIESLNNFRTANVGDDWFLDDITTKGFGFDSVIWRACKNPLGRQGGYRVERKVQNDQGIEEVILEDKPDYELILTPEEMAVMQFAEAGGASQAGPSFTSDRYLVQALRSNALIDGSQALLDDYRARLRSEDPQQAQILQTQALEILKEDVDKFSLKLGDKEEGKLIDVKNGIYRLGDRVVNELASCYDITEELGQAILTVWQKIEAMQSRGVISIDGARHLKEAISIATELRLRTYSHNDGQSEGMSSYIPATRHLTEEEGRELVEKTFYVKDTSLLHHFYYVMIRVQEVVKGFCDQGQALEEPEMVLAVDSLYGDSNYYKAMVHARFLEFSKALLYTQAARDESLENLQRLQDLYILYLNTGSIEQSINLAQEIYGLVKSQNQWEANPSDVANAYNNLGAAYINMGEHDKAVEQFQRALEIQNAVYQSNLNHPSIANSHNNLGEAYYQNGNYDNAIDEYNKALRIDLVVCASSPNYSHIAMTYNNLGAAYLKKEDYKNALENHQKALDIRLAIYLSAPNHPHIAMTYNNLGGVYSDMGNYDDALDAYQKALNIFQVVYVSNPNHPHVAMIYNNLGSAHAAKGDHDQAVECFQKALEINLIVYAFNTNNAHIANSYNNLGNLYQAKGDYDQAIKCHQKALEINLIVYVSNPNHPHIVANYSNLGSAHAAKGDYDQAVECFQKALEINLAAHESNLNHPSIVVNYNNLGKIYTIQGDYDAGVEHHRKAFEISLVVHESSPDHPVIEVSSENLGFVYFCKGEYSQALLYAKTLELRNNILIQLGNQEFLAGNLGQAKEYYEQIDSSLGQMDFYSEAFMNTQLAAINMAHSNNALSPIINCQLVLIRIDPVLEYDNHYQNLACWYAAEGNILEANIAFLKALAHPKAITEGVHAEYAQFLILNRENPVLSDAVQKITEYLHIAITADFTMVFSYGKLEKGNVVGILSDLIQQKDNDIEVRPKALALYLLITFPEYMSNGESIGSVLEDFREYCDSLQDIGSFRLLADSYESIGNEEGAAHCRARVEFIERVDAILSDDEVDVSEFNLNLQDVKEYADKLEKVATGALSARSLNQAAQIYEKILGVFQRIILDETEIPKVVIDNLATISFMLKDIEEYMYLYVYLKNELGAELSVGVVALAGRDVASIVDEERQISDQLKEQDVSHVLVEEGAMDYASVEDITSPTSQLSGEA